MRNIDESTCQASLNFTPDIKIPLPLHNIVFKRYDGRHLGGKCSTMALATQLFLSCQVSAFGRHLLLPKRSSQTQDTKFLS